jgi:Na+-transporting NADH:ubiquinone oxidoreductase subunit NqrD
MTTAETITGIIAGYGAVLSTVAIIKQLAGDRARIKLTVMRNSISAGAKIDHRTPRERCFAAE